MSTNPVMDATTNGDDDDIIQLDSTEADPLAGGDLSAVGSKRVSSPEPIPIEDDDEDEDLTVINGTNSVGDSADDRDSQETALNLQQDATTNNNNMEVSGSPVNSEHSLSRLSQPQKDSGLVITDAVAPFIVEAASFVVQYLLEETGQKKLTEAAAGERLTELDEMPETRKPASDDYFENPVGRFLMSIGTSLVQEYVQNDLLKIQERECEAEGLKNFGFLSSPETTEVVTLKEILEESKEKNKPFHLHLKECKLCRFKTESTLVLSAHLETPHTRYYGYRCTLCKYANILPQEVLFHMEAEHNTKLRLESALANYPCPNCPFEDNSESKLSRHRQDCQKRFRLDKNLEPPNDWDTPAKLPKRKLIIHPAYAAFVATDQVQKNQYPVLNSKYTQDNKSAMPPLMQAPTTKPIPGVIRTMPCLKLAPSSQQSKGVDLTQQRLLQKIVTGDTILPPGTSSQAESGYLMKADLPPNQLSNSSSLLQNEAPPQAVDRPSIIVTPTDVLAASQAQESTEDTPPGLLCEICEADIKDLSQLRNHMRRVHQFRLNRIFLKIEPSLRCIECQSRFFTEKGLERHLLGSHGLVTPTMQDAANKGEDSGHCPLCVKVYQGQLLVHVAKDHHVKLRPTRISYKCTACTATFEIHELFVKHVFSAHAVARNAPRGGNTPNEIQMTGPQDHDGGIKIIEIEDSPKPNDGNSMENGACTAMLSISDSTLRKRNLEISEADEPESYSRGTPLKRLSLD